MFWVQLHQLTPNAIAQLPKYFWVVLSFGREPSSDGFTKRYELHYQPKKVATKGFEKFQQFGVINFHVKRGGEVGLAPAIKNIWSSGGRSPSFIARCPCMSARGEGNPSMLFART
jgi:hypothetical protein